MKGKYIFLANGFEETEAITTTDILRRAGIEVETVSIHKDKFVVGSHGIPVVADLTYGEFKENVVLDGTDSDDLIVFPGGMPGTKRLAEDGEIINFMKLHYAEGGSLAAICAAPGLIVSQLTSLKGKRFTCFEGFQDAPIGKGGIYDPKPAIIDGNLITGRGAGCAVQFALAIVEHLEGKEAVEKVKKGLLV